MSGAAFSHDILNELGSWRTSPMWLRVVALSAARVDKYGVAAFDLMELRSLLRRKDGCEPAQLRSVEAPVGRARSAGLIVDTMGLARMHVPEGIRPVDARSRTVVA